MLKQVQHDELKRRINMEAIAAITKEANALFVIEPIEVEAPRAGEVLVKIAAVGICHTDLAFVSGLMGSPFPFVFGHEGAGIVQLARRMIRPIAINSLCSISPVSARMDRPRFRKMEPRWQAISSANRRLQATRLPMNATS
jgi:threonine dehydrogenase-like Zn-dependent dehydrogenase